MEFETKSVFPKNDYIEHFHYQVMNIYIKSNCRVQNMYRFSGNRFILYIYIYTEYKYIYIYIYYLHISNTNKMLVKWVNQSFE